MQPQRIALINDLSGFGRCSLGVALPVLSALGHQCCMLPTAVLSNHTGYESFTFTDFTPYMEDYICEWKKRELSFSGIYTGFLGSERQVDMIRDFLDGFGQTALKVIDPVMGDHGKAYATFSEDMLQKMSGLAKHADVLTPNVTELMILLERPYPESISLSGLSDACALLSEKNSCYVVVTGVSHELCPDIPDGMLANLCAENGIFTKAVTRPKADTRFAGTGDLFASVLCGQMLRGASFEQAVISAADFVKRCAFATEQNGGREQDGLDFEPYLKELLA